MSKQGPLSGQKAGDKYLLGELLGEGGFGAVYKAQHLYLQRQQAIKVLLEQHLRDKIFRDRFLREAQTVASLDNPYIVHIDDFWVEASRAYLVMPFIRGGTLQDILQQQRVPLELGRIVSYLEHICTALDYAHQRGVVHLDLKPLNLLVHEDGRLLLSDFGLAHLIRQGIAAGGSSLRFGTPHYMAPEHIQGKPQKQSDVYALGMILFQMIIGRLPFDGTTPEAIIFQQLTEAPPSLDTFRSGLPPGLNRVVGKALSKKPEQRYQTSGELLAAFKQALVTPANAKPVNPPATQSQLLLPEQDLIVGDWNVTYGAPAVVTISGSGGAYTVTAKSPVRPGPVRVTGGFCYLPPGTILATFSGSGNTYSGRHSLWYSNDCSFAEWTSLKLTLNGNTLNSVIGNIFPNSIINNDFWYIKFIKII